MQLQQGVCDVLKRRQSLDLGCTDRGAGQNAEQPLFSGSRHAKHAGQSQGLCRGCRRRQGIGRGCSVGLDLRQGVSLQSRCIPCQLLQFGQAVNAGAIVAGCGHQTGERIQAFRRRHLNARLLQGVQRDLIDHVLPSGQGEQVLDQVGQLELLVTVGHIGPGQMADQVVGQFDFNSPVELTQAKVREIAGSQARGEGVRGRWRGAIAIGGRFEQRIRVEVLVDQGFDFAKTVLALHIFHSQEHTVETAQVLTLHGIQARSNVIRSNCRCTSQTPIVGLHQIHQFPLAVRQGGQAIDQGLNARARGRYAVAEGLCDQFQQSIQIVFVDAMDSKQSEIVVTEGAGRGDVRVVSGLARQIMDVLHHRHKSMELLPAVDLVGGRQVQR